MNQVLRSSTFLLIWSTLLLMKKMTGSHLLRSLLMICVLMSAEAGYANTRYVDSTAGNNTNAGTSWAAAYKTLAYAVNQAHSNTAIDTILVAKGTYYPEYMTGTGATNRDRAFTFTRDSLVVMGGYAPGGGLRNLSLYPTILSGALDSCYHVVFVSGSTIDSSLKINGVQITGGKANGGATISINGDIAGTFNGGGIFVHSGSPLFSDTKVFSNFADQFGGGIFSRGCPFFLNCVVTGNTVSRNSSVGYGGGAYVGGSCMTIDRCDFLSNNASAYGGGVYIAGSSQIIVASSIIKGNIAHSGGGLYHNGGGASSVTNVVVAGNIANGLGGGLYISSPVSLTNVTVAGNATSANGAQLYTVSSPTFRNSIVWGNGVSSIVSSGGAPTYANCILDGSGGSTWNAAYGTNSGNNTNVNPLFMNYVAATTGNPTVNGDFRLSACSPATNRGNNSFYTSTDLRDAAARPRIMDDTIDVGAYEVLKPTGRKIYVDSAIVTEGNGGSWVTATRSLAEAIRVANDGCVPVDSILVAKGTYYPEYQAGSTTGLRDKAFTITRNSLVILGGYPTGGGTRNATTNPTVMSGARDTNYHVLLTIGANIDTTLKLDGFTVTNGKANGGSGRITVNGFEWLFYNRGGGWYNGWGSPMLSNMIITSNASDDYGGGVLIEGNPIIRKMLITNNTSNRGGGWAQITGSTKADSLTISNNNAAADGGGWYNNDGASTITNSIFNNNTASWGAGFYNTANTPTVSNCTIRSNTATTEGGGWFNYGGNPVVNNTTIAGNTGGRAAGWYNANGNPTVNNMLMTGNVATGNGGGWFNNGGSAIITNSTIAMNYGAAGRDLVTQNIAMTLQNSIIWSAANSTLTPQPWSGFQNCIVAGSGGSTNWGGGIGSNNGGNLDVNPLFVNAIAATAGNPVTTGDYRLQSCSPAINKGRNSLASGISKDIAGRPRIIGDTVEIGAYEMIKPTGRKIYVDSAIATEGNGNSWATATRSLAEAIKVAHEGCIPVDSILVAKGTYYPEYLTGNGTTNRHKSFTFTRDSLVIIGGYASGGGVRNRNLYPTILSGARDTNVHVLMIAAGSIDSSLKFYGVDVTGGMAKEYSNLVVNGSSINSVLGGGICIIGSSPLFSDIKVLSNYADLMGGGVYSTGCPTFINSLIAGNTSGGFGGGIGSQGGCLNISRCTISGNNANSGGGGVYNSNAVLNIKGSFLIGNRAQTGGGLTFHSSSSTSSSMTDVVITGNTAGTGGGAEIAASIAITNTTFAGNFSGNGSQLYITSSPVLKNSIVWGSGTSSINRQSGSPTYTNCILDGSGTSTWNTAYGSDGGNNSSANPLFVNYVTATSGNPNVNGDVRLTTCSPAINRGDNSFNTNLTDIAGRPRIMGDTIDIGAYETAKPTGHKIYVDSASAINGNGDSWATATRSLAEAVKLAHESCTRIDTILVAKGTYYPEHMTGNDTRNNAFTFTRDSLLIMGGYASGGGVRDRNLYPTILSGAVDQNYHVMVIAGSDIDSTLKFNGIAITGGKANNGSGSISVNGNSIAGDRGGGIYVASGSPVFSDIEVSSNSTSQNGGGIYSRGCPTLLSSIIKDNSAGFVGGGICTDGGGCMTVRQCTILTNNASYAGGGFCNMKAQVTIDRTAIRGNRTISGYGGGYDHSVTSSASITNSVITGNYSNNYGGGLNVSGTISVTNTTIAGNLTSQGGDQLLSQNNAVPVFTNCIIGGTGTNSVKVFSSSPVYTNCIIDGSGAGTVWNTAYGTNGGNNQDVNPMFVNPVAATAGNPTINGDYRLSACSPAINRGNNTFYTNTQLTDIAGRPRIMGDTIDIGAYETAKPTGHKIYVDSASSANGNGDSWATATRSLAEAVKMAHESCTAVDTILVAKGTYNPEYMAGNGTTNKDKSFTFTRDSLVVMGSYASGGGVHDRNLYPTILSGAVDSNYHVMVIAGSNIDSSLKFYGIDITGGRANNFLSSISVNGNLIASNNGGGIHIAAGSPVFSDVKVALNTSTGHGAGIYSMGCPTLFNSLIAHNVVADKIGLIGNGGGIYSVIGCMNVNNCTISSNSVDLGTGGGWHNLTARINVVNTIISDNTARFEGGGLYHYSADAGSSMHNVLITGNNAGPMGGGLYINSPLSLTNVTIAGNSTSSFARQVYIGATSEFKNCIVWGSGGTSIFRGNGSPTYANCILEGTGGSTAWNTNYSVDGGNNKNSDPLFVNPGTRDYRLQFCSPAINAGDNNAIGALATDLAGNPRIIGTTADIGAYEKQSTTTAGSFGNNVALSNARGNASPLLGTSCEDGGWTYYATPNNPDSLSFAIQWGAANATAKAAAQVRLMLDTNNTLAAAGNAATTTMKRYWNVDLNGSTLAAPVSVRFFYNPADTVAMRSALAGQSTGTPGSLRWFKTNSDAFNPSMVSASDVNGGAITLLTPVYGTANNTAYAEFGTINSFSGGTASMAISATPLPVQLIDFTAARTKPGQVQLNWKVANEQLQRYIVMRSHNAIDFQPIGTVQAAGKTAYSLTDMIAESSFANSTIYYRLSLEEYGGTTGYSKVVRINIGNIHSPISVSPNPVQNVFTISQVEDALIGEPITITDATGKLIAQHVLEEGLKVDASQWTSGVYFLRLPGGVTLKMVKL
jgi:hypothetical protein